MNGSRWFAAVVAVAAVMAPFPSVFAGDDDEGEKIAPQFMKVWQAQVTPDQSTMQAGKYAFNDLVLFEEDGFFTAEAFGPLGFGRSEYTLTPLSDTATGFTTTMTNGQQGTIVWNGVLQNQRIIGTLVWTKPDGSVGTYNFTAAPMD